MMTHHILRAAGAAQRTGWVRGLLAGTALAVSMAGLAAPANAQTKGYYQGADEAEGVLVFESEGDLWRTTQDGGAAVRLTTHVEVESDPHISPDGQYIAFNGWYDGPPEIYVMPINGGTPRRLTYEGGGASVRGWTPDGKVFYASASVPGSDPTVMRIVDTDTRDVETLPLMLADHGVFGDDGVLYFIRHGLYNFRDNARVYRGGLMAQLWRVDLSTDEEATQLAPDFPAPIREPMLWQNRIYFMTDESGWDNIWSMSLTGDDVRQESAFEGWPLRNPQLFNGRITFQRGADIFRYDIASKTEEKIDLTLVTDQDASRLRYIDDPLSYLNSFDMGDNGKSVALTARGRVAVAFPGERRRVEIETPPFARARSAALSPDGDWVYMILDQDTIGEIWRYPANGLGDPEQITKDSTAHIWGIYPSPDGERLLFDDKAGRLFAINADGSGSPKLIVQDETGDDSPFGNYSWSKDGRYLAYRGFSTTYRAHVAIYDFETGENRVLTSRKYSSYNPAFSPDGNWLYFLSDRAFFPTPRSPWGDRVPGVSFPERTKVYAFQLVPDAAFPFDEKTELAGEKAKDEDDEASSDEDDSNESDDGENAPRIAWDGLEDRLWEVPVGAGDYFGLAATGKFLYMQTPGDRGTDLLALPIEPNPEPDTFASGLSGYQITADGKKILLSRGFGGRRSFAIVRAGGKAPGDLSDSTIRVGDWRLSITPRAEWRQMMLDAWRMHKAFSFDPSMRGVDWDAVREKYVPLVTRVGHRSELADLQTQMSYELGILHSQVRSGDSPFDEESGNGAYLGAEFNAVLGGLEITRIYRGDPEHPEFRGPLQELNVAMQEGDVINTVDGRSVRTHGELYTALTNKAGQQVRLDYTRGNEKRSAIVTPIRGEGGLRYRHWVQQNKEKVAAASDGRIGYLHLRAMGAGDVATFVRDFYEHLDKDGVVIDVRANFGGNVDSLLINMLLRKTWAFWQGDRGPAYTNMQQSFRGHVAVLIDQSTYSDGETFAAGVKALDIAPLIGRQTAGAGIWLTGRNTQTDFGQARIAEFPQFGLDGRWLIEARGVSPDIEVDNPPRAFFNGEDNQLTTAIEYLQDKIAAEPIPELQRGPLPPVGERGQDVD